MSYRAYCRSCKCDFSGTRMFDLHRTGSHSHLWSPEREDGRRCLGVDEMTAKGWRLDGHGRWVDPTRIAEAHQNFRRRAAVREGALVPVG